jgi:hypothetical protein
MVLTAACISLAAMWEIAETGRPFVKLLRHLADYLRVANLIGYDQ